MPLTIIISLFFNFSLAFSVTLYCSLALISVSFLLVRRNKFFGGGELGGPTRIKYISGISLIGLWIFYLVMSTLEAYDVLM